MFRIARLRRPSPGTMLGGLALIVATSGVAVATVPGGDKTVTACISKDGTLKAIDAEAGKSCQGTQTTAKLAVTDSTGKVANADNLDGRDSTSFLGATAKAGDADLLDGLNSTDFLGATAKAADADKLDGLDAAALEPARIVNVSRAPGRQRSRRATRCGPPMTVSVAPASKSPSSCAWAPARSRWAMPV